MALTARVGLVAARAGRILAAAPGRAAWAVVLVATAVVVAGALRLTAINVDAWTSRWRGGAAMVVYLDPRMPEPRARAIAAELGELDGVVRAELVTPGEAARRLRAALGKSAALLDGVDDAELPASLEVVLEPGGRDVVVASPLLASLRSADAVTGVDLDGEWSDQLSEALQGARHLADGLGLLTLIALGIAALGSLRLALAGGLEAGGERAVARLLGAGVGYVAWPTAVVGMLLGALGAVAGLGALTVLVAKVGPQLAAPVLAIVGGGIAPLPTDAALWLVAAGAAVGGFAGLLAGTGRAAR